MLTVLEKVNVLQKAPMFHAVRTESLAHLAAAAKEVSYEPHETIYAEGDLADSVFVIMEGEANLLKSGQIVGTVPINQVAGALAMLAGQHHTESAVATQPTRALLLDQEDFYDAVAEDFQLTRGILRTLARAAAGGGSGR